MALPPRHVSRVQVIHIGDSENPVPLNIFRSDNPADEERTISDLNLLFGAIFDPKNNGYVGPRWERWFSTFAALSIAVFKEYASFEIITYLSQGRSRMRKAYDLISHRYPALANTLQEEFGKLSNDDFNSLIGWTLCKMQRLTSVPQLRLTLGAGANALDFSQLLESDTVTLIDLASPVIGMHAARIIGTLILMQLWNAVLNRKNRDKTHLVFLDEAHLFQTDPLPQMLAESRKFSIGMILAHQHCGQLSSEILDALEANSASFSAFHLSVKDACHAALRLNDESIAGKLCRLHAYNAITTLSVDGRQTEPFTLQIQRTPERKNYQTTIDHIQRQSVRKLVTPYRNCRPLTQDEMQQILDGKPVRNIPYGTEKEPDWLTRWNDYQEESDLMIS